MTRFAWSLTAAAAFAQGPSAAEPSGPIAFREALVTGGADWYRSASSMDALEARLVRGEWSPPREGDPFAPGDDHRWTRVVADSAGWIASDSLLDGWASAVVESHAERTVILEGFGYRTAWIDGVWRSGNVYGWKEAWDAWEPRFDFSRVPVKLRPGRNDFLFAGSRAGAIKVRLLEPPASGVFLNARDVTLPDLVEGQPTDAWAAVVVGNARDDEARGLRLEAAVDAEAGPTIVSLPALLPTSVRKVAFRLRASQAGGAAVSLRLLDAGGGRLDEATLPLVTRRPDENRRCTFVSDVDGSVQFFGLLPAAPPAAGAGDAARERHPALFLSLHGAGVDAFNQSGSYRAKAWGHVVAPTNRRPFGFNWEDWGRIDALEVLDLATHALDVDPERVYLTGHSMGGHGAWHVGVLYPERFAAIGPSAGWLDFWSYRPERSVEPRDDVERMISRATLPSRTLALAENLAGVGVYVLHGVDDDNVPVAQARTMVARLAEFHRDFVAHEEPRAGHWWDKSDEPGTDCVDFPEMFDFFARHARPPRGAEREVHFITPNPGLSATSAWARIEAQRRPLEPSRVDLRLDPARRRFVGTTANVARLALDTAGLAGEGAVALDLDGASLVATPENGTVTLTRDESGWTAGGPAPPSFKGPARSGPFKDAFRHRVLFVYGTAGTREENAWALAKARFDAEQFWYDGNGSIDVVPDARFDPADEPDRNVVLYGNASTNRAWRALLGEGPVRVARNELRVGKKRLRGDDLAALFLRPRPGSDFACVAAVSGTGITGMRLCDRRPYLSPGFAYPDLTVLRASASIPPASCAIFAGFFGIDWSVEAGEWAGTGSLAP